MFADEREDVQKKSFTKWINSQLAKVLVATAPAAGSAAARMLLVCRCLRAFLRSITYVDYSQSAMYISLHVVVVVR